MVRNGTRSSGVQRYKCKHCGRNFTEAAANPFGTLQAEPAAILAAAHAILVDKSPVQYVADDYGVSWATAKKWAERVAADPSLLQDAKRLVEGVRADVEAVFELVEVAELLGLLRSDEASELRSTGALDPAVRRRRLHELATIVATARETRDLVSEIRSALAKEAAGKRRRR